MGDWVDQAVTLYKSGMSLSEVGQSLGKSFSIRMQLFFFNVNSQSFRFWRAG